MALSTVAAIIGQAQAQTASSWEPTPVIVAFVLPIVGLAVTLMRYQHVDSTKTRDLIERTAKETARETTKQLEKATKQFDKQFDLLRAAIGAIGDRPDDFGDRLNDARERLARIEGRLDATHPQPDGNDGEDSRDAA